MSHTHRGPADAEQNRPGERNLLSAEVRDRSTGELVNDLIELVPRLIRDELALALAEMREKGRRAGIGTRLFSVGGVLGLYGGAALVAAAVLGLAEALPAWLSALIVGLVLLAVGGVLALLARRQLARAVPPTPEHALAGVREDIATVKSAAGGHPAASRTT
jgi:VIT1/CCC1 family predicted Fe2+/Mn2+ transporter